MIYTAKHVGEGKFEVTLHETNEIKDAGSNLCGMIRYTYFEDYILPPIGWEVTSKKLIEDYHPKVFNDISNGKIQK
tara:strand:+ start:31810 stop:32037 length:228 start_codon:yes stop_codon:yes gene_type:complete